MCYVALKFLLFYSFIKADFFLLHDVLRVILALSGVHLAIFIPRKVCASGITRICQVGCL